MKRNRDSLGIGMEPPLVCMYKSNLTGMQSEPGARRGHLQQHHPPQGGADRGSKVHRHAAGLQRHSPGQTSFFYSMTVAYSDSHPTMYVAHGRAKPVFRGPNITEPNLFPHEETTYRVG